MEGLLEPVVNRKRIWAERKVRKHVPRSRVRGRLRAATCVDGILKRERAKVARCCATGAVIYTSKLQLVEAIQGMMPVKCATGFECGAGRSQF